jgi:hypothetical protein
MTTSTAAVPFALPQTRLQTSAPAAPKPATPNKAKHGMPLWRAVWFVREFVWQIRMIVR